MFERFTATARESVLHAQTLARELRQPVIGSEHVLLGVLWHDSGPARQSLLDAGLDYPSARERLTALVGDGLDPKALASLGIDLDAIRARVEGTFGPGALDGPRRPAPKGHLPFGKGAKKALELALREAIALQHARIGGEHILLGVLGDVGSLAHRLLEGFAVDPIMLRNDLRRRLREPA